MSHLTQIKDRVILTEELLRYPLGPEETGFDKIYTTSCFTAMFNQTTTINAVNRFTLDLTEAPIVVINDQIKKEMGLHPDTPLLNYMRELGKKGKERFLMQYGKFWLVSSGYIPFFGGEMFCLRRDPEANTDPGALTTPAGRMDMPLSRLCCAELNEEMDIIVEHHTGKILLLGQYNSKLSKDSMIVKKLSELQRIKEYLTTKGIRPEWIELLEKIRGPRDILPQNLDEYEIGSFNDPRSDQIRTVINFETIDFTDGIVFVDKSSNTIEHRKICDLTEPGFKLKAVIPAEIYMTPRGPIMNDSCTLTKQELFNGINNGSLKATPTLNYYINRLMEENNALEYFSNQRTA